MGSAFEYAVLYSVVIFQVIMRRCHNATVNFDREWRSYKEGFGNFAGNFWIGWFIMTM